MNNPTTKTDPTSDIATESNFYAYHHATKHTLESLYSSSHRLDWNNQPDPFRVYAATPVVKLPEDPITTREGLFDALTRLYSRDDPTGDSELELATMREETRESSEEESHPLRLWALARGSAPLPRHASVAPGLEFLSSLLYYSMALSAWKQIRGTDHRWALRVNPSSGNLHPTETHLLLPAGTEAPTGVFHYRVAEHGLEERTARDVCTRLWSRIRPDLPLPATLVCLTSIFWRESWKYQSRAFRYCQHDLGHALGSIILSAQLLGWRSHVIGEFPDETLRDELGLSSSDECPLALVALYPRAASPASGFPLDESPVPACGESAGTPVVYSGTPNVLSSSQIEYPLIDRAWLDTCLTSAQWSSRRQSRPDVGRRGRWDGPSSDAVVPLAELVEPPSAELPAHYLIRKRRSCLGLDARETVSLRDLARMLAFSTRGFQADFLESLPLSRIAAEEPGGDAASALEDSCFDESSRAGRGSVEAASAQMEAPAALREMGFFIHLYVYAHRVEGLPPGVYYFDRLDLSLRPVQPGDHQKVAKFVSCLQDIAADGCFAISMIADFNAAYTRFGDRCYRYVHHEAGFIGQMLYLTSLSCGLESTGIGCFMDDEVNRYLELPAGVEVVYNFTVGRAVPDPRLTDLPSYPFPDPGLELVR